MVPINLSYHQWPALVSPVSSDCSSSSFTFPTQLSPAQLTLSCLFVFPAPGSGSWLRVDCVQVYVVCVPLYWQSDNQSPVEFLNFLNSCPQIQLQTTNVDNAMHCGPRGFSRRSELYEHLFCMFWASNYRPTTGHNLVRSDLDFWLDSTPFWCKNHFCSLKTGGVIKYFLTKKYF